MSTNKHWFQNFVKEEGGKVLLDNLQECSIKRRETIQIKIFDNQVRELTDVRYVPNLKRNLISLDIFYKASYTCKLENCTLKISKGAMVKIRGRLHNGLYVMEVNTIVGTTAIVSRREQDEVKLWHESLGHISEAGLKHLCKQGLLGRLL